MNDKDKASDSPAAGEATKSKPDVIEPSNILVQTTRKRVKIRNAIVSGVPNFGIRQAEADELVANGDVTIIGKI